MMKPARSAAKAFSALSGGILALAVLAGASQAQGWRGEPGLPQSRGGARVILAQAGPAAWDAARLNRFFDAEPIRPAPRFESSTPPFRYAQPRGLSSRRTRSRAEARAFRSHRLLIPTPRLTPTYRLTFRQLLAHQNDTDRYDDLIVRYSAENGLDPRLVKSIIAAESEFNWDAHSPKGARGLMQVMPRTARRFGVSPSELTTPEGSIKAGTAYLAELFKTVERFYGLEMKSFIQAPLWLTERVIACYYAGPTRLRRDRWLRQTKLYVRRVLLFYGSAVSRFHWAPTPDPRPAQNFI